MGFFVRLRGLDWVCPAISRAYCLTGVPVPLQRHIDMVLSPVTPDHSVQIAPLLSEGAAQVKLTT